MKKKKLKNYLKLGILLFGVSIFFIACQKEEFNVIENVKNTTTSYKVVSLNQLTKLKPIIENVKHIKPKSDILSR
ncbi:hypothetical protein DFR65_1075 [Oceanihabitans sediminis]|uniref:Lipoprotein n=1 Tax=Oceanihabitans sediminis TaxID=1812012 RepID=A0A368P156_9FLAO|nr:hypothetical protein [Oceanihabitans sediminis]RBP28389.1 hypothetical protein DFR65_1075 [Oceanihabitans sediminis]RCU56587.1 hypothetical protein DU428_11890 [Oceanihabitans sediminis]